MASYSKRGSSLIVEPPSQVRFPGPSLRPARASIKLINNTSTRIAFKIKTTAPSFYGVRPNSGVILPQTTTVIEIARQPFTHAESTKINHKFMVQSIVVPDDMIDLSKLWENVDQKELGITKLRCVFEDSPRRSTDETAPKAQLKPELPIPERQESPHKILSHKSDANKSNEQLATVRSRKHSSNEGSISTLEKENEMQSEPRKQDSSLESMRRILHGNGTSKEATIQKSSLDNEPSIAEQKILPQQQVSREDKTGLNSKQVSYASLVITKRYSEDSKLDRPLSIEPTLSSQRPKHITSIHSNNSANISTRQTFSAQPSPTKLTTPTNEFDRQPSVEPTLSLQPPKYLTSFQSNNSANISIKKPFSAQSSPTKLTTPKISQNQMQVNEKAAQIPSRDRQEKKPHKTSEIFTQLQVATMNTEIHQLRTENKYLLKENTALREEIQQRHQLQSSPIRGEYIIPHTDLPQMQQQVPLCYVIASMTFALLCLIIGKFVL